MEGKKHIWQFSRVGGVNRVNLERGSDLTNLKDLDQKLWAALSCPVNGLEIDHKTLELIDNDNDGKIRVLEVRAAVTWILAIIKNPDDLLLRSHELPLQSINTESELGKTLFASAKQILANLGKPDASSITIAETSDTAAIFANTKFNGDGIITVDSADSLEIGEWISIIIDTVGSVTDRCGKEGISKIQLEDFVEKCSNYANWLAIAEDNKDSIFPFGDKSEATYNLYKTLKVKIDDYFLRCKLAVFEPDSAQVLNSITSRIEEINNRDLSECYAEIEGFPIAKINKNQYLSFVEPINPAWRQRLIAFKAIIGLHAEIITEDQWIAIGDKFVSYENWLADKPQSDVEALGFEQIKRFIDSDVESEIIGLLEMDVDLEDEASNIILVDKLVRYYCHIYTLLNNFVTFHDFYSLEIKGIFQAGVLYYDQRSCDLCIKVSDMAKHNTMAASSGICLVYFNCISHTKNEQMVIVAAFTDGDIDDLTLGRNAIFYDNDGCDWDASVIKIIDNSISIRQAFWTPYRRVSKLVGNQIEKFTSSQDDKVTGVASSNIQDVGKEADSQLTQAISSPQATQKGVQPAPFDIAKFAGIFAAIGLAFGAIGSALASIVGGFIALTWWKMPIVLIGIVLAISGPSMILSWFKLRKRNLASVLDANGWAINAKATINIPFGTTLTHLVKLPPNSKLNLKDPFAKKKNPFIPIVIVALVIIVALAILWYKEWFGTLAK